MQRLIKAGKVKPKSSLEVKKSRVGLGFEKLDRDVFDPNKAYDKVCELGIIPVGDVHKMVLILS